MASTQEHGTSTGGRSSLFERLEAKPHEAAYAAFGLAVVFGCASVILAIKYRTNNLPITLWAFLLGVCFLVAGVWRLLGQTSRLPERDFVRFQVLVLGGVLGSLTVLFLGLGLTWTWWETISGGWQVWQGKEGWRLWVVLLALVAGLAIMFISLQFCQGDETSSSLYRRMIFAYNAFLSVWLLLLVLIVVNVLVYVPWGPLRWFNTTNYWAKSSMLGLSPRSEKILESLDQPLKVYVLLPRPDPWYTETRVLMDNARQFAKNMVVEYLSPDLDREKIAKLNDEYKFGDRRGVLLIYGKSSEAKNRFIKYTDLVESPDPRDRQKQGSFTGEKAFINELYTLSEDKEKPVIYFTQGNGEADLFDAAQGDQIDKGLGVLRQRLEAVYYKVKGLRLTSIAGAKADNPDLVTTNEVPADAAVVVIAGPKQKLQDAALTALNNYMNPPPASGKKPGKMVVLLDVNLTPDKKMVQTGLEPFLTQFGVEVGNSIVLHAYQIDGRQPEYVQTFMNPEESMRERNAIVAAFKDLAFRNYKVRPVTAIQNPPGAPSRFRVDPIIYVDPNTFIWAESQVGADFKALTDEYTKRGEMQDLISRTAISIAVAVSETSNPSLGNPHVSLQDNDKPRMIVVGDASWLCNFFMGERLGTLNYDIFNSMLAWLRERPNNIGIDAKKRESYALAPNADLSRMFWVPSILMVVGVIGLGAGVWVVRRR
jgi:hypothetical protein